MAKKTPPTENVDTVIEPKLDEKAVTDEAKKAPLEKKSEGQAPKEKKIVKKKEKVAAEMVEVKPADEIAKLPVEVKPEGKAETKSEVKKELEKVPEVPKKIKRGIVHIYSSSNNTLIHITDITGADTFARVSGGMVTKQDRLKGAPFQAMQAADKAIEMAKAAGVTNINILVRAPGGHKELEMGKGAEHAIKAFSKSSLKIDIVEDVTPIIHGMMKKKGGRRGRRL